MLLFPFFVDFNHFKHVHGYVKHLESHDSFYIIEYSHVLSATDSQLSLKEIDTWAKEKKALVLFICIIHSRGSAIQICISSDILFSTW